MRSNVVNINETKVISVFLFSFFFFLSNGLFEGVCTDELRDYEGSPGRTESGRACGRSKPMGESA